MANLKCKRQNRFSVLRKQSVFERPSFRLTAARREIQLVSVALSSQVVGGGVPVRFRWKTKGGQQVEILQHREPIPYIWAMSRSTFSCEKHGRGCNSRHVHMQKRQSDELQSYKDAIWDYILEHSDITDGGSYFVKFHTTDRRNFENRILARWKYGYHRTDDRLKLDIRAKEKHATALRQAHLSRKESKQRKYILSRDEQRKAHEELERKRQEDIRVAAMKPLYRHIHTKIMQPLAQKWYNIKQLWKQNRPQIKK